MNAAQRAKGLYVGVTLWGPKKKSGREALAGGGQFFSSTKEARKAFAGVFKKLTGNAPTELPW